MSNKKLVLFTVNYPYSNTEKFIDDELNVFSDIFESILIVPAIINNHLRNNYKSNFHVDTSLFDKSLINIIYGISGLPLIINDILDKENKVNVFSKDVKTNFTYILRGLRLLGWYMRRRQQNDTRQEHYYFYWSNSDAYGASLAKRLTNPELYYVMRAHGGDLYIDKPQSRHLPFRKAIYSNCNHVFPISKDGYDYLIKNYPYLEHKLTIARLGVNCSQIKVKKLITNEENILHIVSCSFDRPLKRIWLIRDLVVTLSREIPKKLIWTHIGIDRETFKKHYIPKKLPSNCEIKTKGILNQNQILEFYQKTQPDYFINLSVTEGIPVTIMEALCSSIPVIATNVGGISEIVDDSVGLLVEKDFDITEVVNCLVNKQDQIKGMRERARMRALKIADADINYKKFANKIISIKE